MTRITITHDIPGGQPILVPPRPATFTVSAEGGTPPNEYQWRINNFLLRDWDPRPTLVWDGLSLNGSSTLSGAYTLVVTGRSQGTTNAITAATLNFQLQYR